MKHALAALMLAALLPAAPLVSQARAGDSEIRQAVTTLAPGAQVKSIAKTALPGIMEVVIDGANGPMVVYADDKGLNLLVGDLLDVKSRRNLTRERMDQLTAVSWDSLPLQNAIKIVKGAGKRKLAVFSDPDCPYCKKAEFELAKLDNVSIYIFPYPLPMHPDAERKAKLVWCSKDRAQAWQDLLLKGKLPAGKADCANPVDENLALGQKLRIDGTPAMIFANGKRVPGYRPAEQLEAMLAAANGGNGKR